MDLNALEVNSPKAKGGPAPDRKAWVAGDANYRRGYIDEGVTDDGRLQRMDIADAFMDNAPKWDKFNNGRY